MMGHGYVWWRVVMLNLRYFAAAFYEQTAKKALQGEVGWLWRAKKKSTEKM
jgi:hypothetical protein